MNAMSEDNKYEKYAQPQPEKRAAVDIQELNITGTPLRSIFFKNNNSSVIVIIAGILLIMLRKPASIVLGIFCIALALFVWFKVGDAKVIDIYRDFLIIYSDKDPNKAIKVNMDEIEEWAIKNNSGGNDAVMVKLNSGETIFKDTFQLGRFYKVMFDIIPERESRQIQMAKNREQKLEFHNPFKKWFKK